MSGQINKSITGQYMFTDRVILQITCGLVFLTQTSTDVNVQTLTTVTPAATTSCGWIQTLLKTTEFGQALSRTTKVTNAFD